MHMVESGQLQGGSYAKRKGREQVLALQMVDKKGVKKVLAIGV